MILRDVTGDTMEYVYVTNIEDNSSGRDISVNYTYLQNGETRTLNGAAKYAIQGGGAMLSYEKAGLKSIRQLSAVTLDSLSSLSAMGGGKSYKLAEDVQILLRDSASGEGWYLADPDQVDGGDYKLTGWYDTLNYSAGGRIRVITATAK